LTILPDVGGKAARNSNRLPPHLQDQATVDGFVKSPSAALRFNFAVAAHLGSALPSSVFARLASGAFCKTIVLVTFYEIINGSGRSLKLPRLIKWNPEGGRIGLEKARQAVGETGKFPLLSLDNLPEQAR
jgi:hypothetical protein